jgi:hypothetical protein
MQFNKRDDSTAGKIRPRFKLKTKLKQNEIMDIIQNASTTYADVVSSKYDRFIRISMPINQLHTWSPVLMLSFEEDENDYTVVRALIGPAEWLWQTLMVFYIGFSVLGFFASIYALVEWQLRNNTNWLAVIPITIIILLSIFIISKIGQHSARKQMLHLLLHLRRAVDETDCIRID